MRLMLMKPYKHLNLVVPRSHQLLGLLDNGNGAVAAPLALHALPGVVLFECPAVPWSLAGRSAICPPGGDWPLRKGVVGLLVQSGFAGHRSFNHLRCCGSSSLATHAAAIASLAVEEKEPYRNPDDCDDRNDSDNDQYGNGGS